MRRRRWLLETFWGNVLLLPFLAVLAYYSAARQDGSGSAIFVLAIVMIANCACNMGIIVATDNEVLRAAGNSAEGDSA